MPSHFTLTLSASFSKSCTPNFAFFTLLVSPAYSEGNHHFSFFFLSNMGGEFGYGYHEIISIRVKPSQSFSHHRHFSISSRLAGREDSIIKSLSIRLLTLKYHKAISSIKTSFTTSDFICLFLLKTLSFNSYNIIFKLFS